MSDKKKAFTLIELLVVIAIIGILATISVLALQNARAKSRDAKRVADIKQMQTALELYFNDINHYPTAEEFAEGSIHSTSSLGTTTYMTHIPSAPMPADGGCSPTDNTYVYTQEDGGGNYSLDFCLGGQVASLSPGSKCSTSNAIYDGNCCTSISVYYAGKNYNAAKVGNQCWLAENLNVGTMIWDPSTCIVGGSSCAADPDNSFDYNNIEKYCYQNTESNCSTFGALYSWTEAFALPHSCKDVGDYVCATLSGCQSVSTPTCNFSLMRRGICPSGWHLPS